MAEFTVDLQPLKQSFSDMDLLNNLSTFESLNSNELPSNNVHGFPRELPVNFSNDNMSSSMDIPNVAVYDQVALFFPPGSAAGPSHVTNNINKASESEYVIHSSSSVSANEFLGANKKNGNENQSGKKRKRNIDRKVEKPKEVIHVRAKRGQATDSHSLAERLRREKINDKFRCLQDLVPGCYKTMGMAVMLDVIINYVRSLQNQIDFLSMKLSAASLFHDFNSPDHVDAMAGMQGMNAYEANGMERMLGEGYEGFPQFQTTWPR